MLPMKGPISGGTFPAMQDNEPSRGRRLFENRVASATLVAMILKFVLFTSNKGVTR
jgi:hypothetical protein